MLFFALLLPLAFARWTPLERNQVGGGVVPINVELNPINPMVNDGTCHTQREMCHRMEHKCSQEWIMCTFGGRCMPIDFPEQTVQARKCKQFVRTSCPEMQQPELEEACVFHTMGITVIGVDEVGCAQQVQLTGEEMKRRTTTGMEFDQFCSQERVRSLYGNRCRAQLPIHQLRNLENCKREFRNSCPFDRREPVMRFCEMETGIMWNQWMTTPSMWPTWLTQQQTPYQTYPYHHQSTGQYGQFPYGQQSQYGQYPYGQQSSMNPLTYPFWMTRRHSQSYSPYTSQHGQYGQYPYSQQTTYGPYNYDQQTQYGQYPYGQQSQYGQYPYGQSQSSWMTGDKYGQYTPYGTSMNPYMQMGQQPWYQTQSTNPICEHMVRKMCMVKPEYQQYGQTQYGQQSQYGQYPYGQQHLRQQQMIQQVLQQQQMQQEQPFEQDTTTSN